MSRPPRPPGDEPRPRRLERSIAAAHRIRSLESRAGGILSLGIVCAMAIGLLAWYYGAALRHPAGAAAAARARSSSRSPARMSLPPLPALGQLRPAPGSAASAGPPAAGSDPTPAAPASASPPATALARPLPWVIAGRTPDGMRGRSELRPRGSRNAPDKPRHGLDRRLSGPVFAAQSAGISAGPGATSAFGASRPAGAAPMIGAPPIAGGASAPGGSPRPADDSSARLASLLTPTPTAAVVARVLPTRTLLLPKGTFIDCTLETAIDSTLPGLTTCITATDTFGADGKVVLLERGSKLIGETRGQVRQGSARIFVLWTEARTPTGVVIPLASPGTDALGRAGVHGSVSRHFFQRFGAALLISIIEAGSQVAAQTGGGAVIYGPGASQQVATEVLRQTLRIAPTVVAPQGARIQVLVARDIDFRPVYELRIANSRH